MSTMLVEIYDALKKAGASEEKARAAATSLTGRDQRWDEVDQRFQRVEQRQCRAPAHLIEQALEALTKRVATLEEKVIAVDPGRRRHPGRMSLMKWMHGITIGGVLALLVKTFFG